MTRFFLVSQNKSHDYEFEHHLLWSPKLTKNGGHNQAYDLMSQLRDGDIIFHVYDQRLHAISRVLGNAYEHIKPDNKKFKSWNDLGWQADCYMNPLNISLYEHRNWFKNHSGGPFDKNGKLSQKYLSELNFEQTKFLFSLVADKDLFKKILIYGKSNNIGTLFSLEKNKLPVNMNIDKQSENHKVFHYDENTNFEDARIGKIGELAVLDFLRNKYSQAKFTVEGLSSNLRKNGDDNLGYDIKLSEKSSGKIYYIDVKSTKGLSSSFYMSENERQTYLLTKENLARENYEIYRVYDIDETSRRAKFDIINLSLNDKRVNFQAKNYLVTLIS